MTALAEALVKAQGEMPAVGKDSSNPHFRSKFASLDHIIELTRPVLNKHGLSIHQFPAHNDLGAPTLVTRISHTSGESLEYAAPLFLQGQDMQKYGAALTYARRYAWSAALGIATEDDDDGNTASAPSEKESSFVAPTTNGSSSKPPAPPANASNGGPKVISDAQGKRLWAIAKTNDVSADRLKEIVKEVTGQESSKEIPVAKYDEICTLVEAEALPF